MGEAGLASRRGLGSCAAVKSGSRPRTVGRSADWARASRGGSGRGVGKIGKGRHGRHGRRPGQPHTLVWPVINAHRQRPPVTLVINARHQCPSSTPAVNARHQRLTALSIQQNIQCYNVANIVDHHTEVTLCGVDARSRRPLATPAVDVRARRQRPPSTPAVAARRQRPPSTPAVSICRQRPLSAPAVSA